MFTGIVQTQATVIAIDDQGDFRSMTLSVGVEHLQRLSLGASIAINGVCLTVTSFENTLNDVVGQVQFDVIDETLAKTNLDLICVGDKVNFERSVTFGTEMGGHIVSGHIQTTAVVSSIIRTANNCEFQLTLGQEWMKYILHKGFVSVNGCSLTVGDVTETGFALHLIPETLNITNLGVLNEGSKVNIEVDQQTFSIVQTVERVLKRQYSKADWFQ